ncbi:MAG: glycosyl hydrolase [Rikenellaceae bacterium]
MRKRTLLIPAVLLLIVIPLTEIKANPERRDGKYALITDHATPQTKALYQRIAQMQGKGVLFGHHYSNVSGINFTDWEQETDQSDVKTSVSDHPAIFGFDFGQGFSKQLEAVKSAARKGGVITFSDHMRNPINPRSYNHKDGLINEEIASVLPGGKHHDVLVARLDSIADFASKAVINGEKIPIIYRPWHEHTGRWFWWGIESGTSEEYCQLWHFTIDYLRKVKGVDNFIYAFSPAHFEENYNYERRNPGAEYFDIAGLDLYSKDGESEAERLISALEVVVEYAEANNKVPALTEFGYRNGIKNSNNPRWYTENVLNPILDSEKAKRVVYALTWRNRPGQYWIPLQGNPNYDDFVEFYKSPYTIFLRDWKAIKTK